MTISSLEQIVEPLGWVLVHSLWQFTLIALLGALIQRTHLLSAAARSNILAALLFSCFLLPWTTWRHSRARGAGRWQFIAGEPPRECIDGSRQLSVGSDQPVPAGCFTSTSSGTSPGEDGNSDNDPRDPHFRPGL